MDLSSPQLPTSPPAEETHPERMARRRGALRIQLEQIFSGPGRFTWELGCGHGHFLTAYAAAHPAELCVGIDIMSDRIARAERKRERSRLGNLFFLRADARLFLEALPPGVLFSELFILFPDPWPKARHHKHRIIQPDFLSEAARHSTPDSRLCFRTDYKPYFEDARLIFEQHPDWQLAVESWPFEYDTVFQARAIEHQSLIARRATDPAQP
jgi:tRNA (guanine-N7-)-methyltransferase